METALRQAAVMTFEELGFLFTTPELNEQQRNAPVDAAVSVAFNGPLRGHLMVQVSGDWLPTLAANMLGEDEPPPPGLQHDALREIANVICGNVLPAITGSREVFYLSPPQIVEDTTQNGKPPTAAAHIGLEGGRADVLLFLDESS
ncbi:MAG: chemotaxis protein CheX [Abditibacteriales bacterium]|nr:chemotaxis protein CheX [Abditibacteriales bacterium]MDW8366754.1 chemotaxis protein CheX [Abditibacteriales bacterium]